MSKRTKAIAAALARLEARYKRLKRLPLDAEQLACVEAQYESYKALYEEEKALAEWEDACNRRSAATILAELTGGMK